MNNNDIVKWIGIITLLAMVLSLVAVAFLYGPTQNDSASELSNEQLYSTNEEFFYNISFETKTLSELNALRMVAKTDSLEKENIDSAVTKIDGVSRISSRLTKLENFEGWFYYAEIYLKRGTSASLVAENVLSLDFFSQNSQEQQVLKYMSVSTPGQIKLVGTDSNITRDYNFDSGTVSALVGLSTISGDNVSVSGTIGLIGKNISSLELIEESNLTAQPIDYSLTKKIILEELTDKVTFEGEREIATYLNPEEFKTKLKTIDENGDVFVYSFDNSIKIISNEVFEESVLQDLNKIEGIINVESEEGTIYIDSNLELIETTVPKIKSIIDSINFSSEIILPKETAYGFTSFQNSNSVQELLQSNGFVSEFIRDSSFFLDKIYIEELGKEFDFNSNFPAKIKTNHKVGDEVEVELTISVQRDKIVQVTGIEN